MKINVDKNLVICNVLLILFLFFFFSLYLPDFFFPLDLIEIVERMESLSSNGSNDKTCNELKRTISDFEDELREREKKKIKIMTPILTSALDRTLTSDHNAVFIIAATAVSLGHKLDDILLSRSTIRRARIANREKLAVDLKNNFHCASNLILHFDGKILQDLTGTEMIDRIPVVISGLNTSHVLGAPKVDSGTGLKQAEAVIKTIDEWQLRDHVKGMCFDTTTVNTGNTLFICLSLFIFLIIRFYRSIH